MHPWRSLSRTSLERRNHGGGREEWERGIEAWDHCEYHDGAWADGHHDILAGNSGDLADHGGVLVCQGDTLVGHDGVLVGHDGVLVGHKEA